MKKNYYLYKIIISVTLYSILFPQSFSTSNPPLVYIYNFVNHDSLLIVSHDSTTSIRIPTETTLPELISTMISTEIGKYPQLKIAGESLQDRLKPENILKLLKSSQYPENTDYIIIGEVNFLNGTIEIDFKLIDVSIQEVVFSNSLSKNFNDRSSIRSAIKNSITPMVIKILKPFTGVAYVKLNKSHSDQIRWDYIAIRSKKTLVEGKIVSTSESDLQIYNTIPLSDKTANTFFKNHKSLLSSTNLFTYGVIVDKKLVPIQFLEGTYHFRAYLVNNQTPFEVEFDVVPGNLNEIRIEFPPIPKLPPPPKGNISLQNIQNGTELVLQQLKTEKILNCIKKKGQITFFENYISSDVKIEKSSVMIRNVDLGEYTLIVSAISESRQPGKQYTNIYSHSETFKLKKNKELVNIKIPGIDIVNAEEREIIIYFNPFTEEDEVYSLFFEGSDEPFSKLRIAGEAHILGLDPKYGGNIIVKRNGYEPAIIRIKPGKDKFYALADLTIPVKSANIKPSSKKKVKLYSTELWKRGK